MFDVAPSEFFIVALVALIVIGPKDLPKAMRVVGYWVGRARGVARQFRSGFDSMVREAELAEMEKKWAEENARILAEHPSTEHEPATTSEPLMLPLAEGASASGETAGVPATLVEERSGDAPDAPLMVEKPVVEPAPTAAQPPAENKVGL